MLGFILVLVAATSSHAATMTHRSTSGTRGAERHLTVAHHGVHRHTAGSAVRVRLPVR